MRKEQFNKVKVIIDFSINFVSIETMNGRLIASGEYNINKEKRDMYISDVSVQDKYRGKGYGSLLARVMISIAKYYQLKTISLTDGSTLEGFWQRLGFVWIKKRQYWILDLMR